MKQRIFLLVFVFLFLLAVPALNLGAAGPNTLSPPASSALPTQGTVSGDEAVSQMISSPQNSAELPSFSGENEIKIYDQSSQRVLTLTLADYALGAAMAEIPPTYHAEAIKAQAISALSYALYCKNLQSQNPNPDLQGAALSVDIAQHLTYVDETTARQMYGDQFDVYYPKMKEACAAVANQILLYDGQPILAAYHAISMGYTESSENIWGNAIPYLVSVESAGDRLASGFASQNTFTKEELLSTFQNAYPDFVAPTADPWIAVTQRSASGSALQVSVSNLTLSGQEVRELLGLRSPNFEVTFSGDQVLFDVYGYGHSVGLSQNGADFFARQGQTYSDILAHYYPNTTLAVLSF